MMDEQAVFEVLQGVLDTDREDDEMIVEKMNRQLQERGARKRDRVVRLASLQWCGHYDGSWLRGCRECRELMGRVYDALQEPDAPVQGDDRG